jgi:sulfide:quinone oxidoreductase
VATCLSEALGDQVAVTLIDKSDSFVFGYAKLDVMFGRSTPDEIHLPYRAINKPGVTFTQAEIQAIDPAEKRIITDQGTFDGDVLVIALGADYDLAATPGLAEGGNEFYSVSGAKHVRDVLAAFAGGTVVVGVLTPHYKCPPAPSEAALLTHDYLAERGLRERSRIIMASPFPSPLPVSPEAGAAVLARLHERGIEFVPHAFTTHIDAGEHRLHLADGRTLPYDLLLAVPVHVAPPVVLNSALAEGGWIPVDRRTLQTRFPDVYAIGDVTSVGTPRAGVFSEGAGKVVAEQLIARYRGSDAGGPYQGDGTCYIEWGDGAVAGIYVNFLGGPTVTARFTTQSGEGATEKARFGQSRRARWFGL